MKWLHECMPISKAPTTFLALKLAAVLEPVFPCCYARSNRSNRFYANELGFSDYGRHSGARQHSRPRSHYRPARLLLQFLAGEQSKYRSSSPSKAQAGLELPLQGYCRKDTAHTKTHLALCRQAYKTRLAHSLESDSDVGNSRCP